MAASPGRRRAITRRWKAAVAAGAALTVLASGGCEDPVAEGPVPASVEIVSERVYTGATVGGEKQLTAIVRDAEGAVIPGASVEWSSSNPELVPVDTEGLARAPASYAACEWRRPPHCGAHVTARSGNVSDEITFLVFPPPAVLHVEPEDTTIAVGEVFQLRGSATVEGHPVGWCNAGVFMPVDTGIVDVVIHGGRVEGLRPGTTRIAVGNTGTYCPPGYETAFATVTVVAP